MREYSLRMIQAIFHWPFHSSDSQYTTLEVQNKLFTEEYKVLMVGRRFPGQAGEETLCQRPPPTSSEDNFHLKEVLGCKGRKYHT